MTWSVNADEEYHEESGSGEDEGEVDRYDIRQLSKTQPLVPSAVTSPLKASIGLEGNRRRRQI